MIGKPRGFGAVKNPKFETRSVYIEMVSNFGFGQSEGSRGLPIIKFLQKVPAHDQSVFAKETAS